MPLGVKVIWRWVECWLDMEKKMETSSTDIFPSSWLRDREMSFMSRDDVYRHFKAFKILIQSENRLRWLQDGDETASCVLSNFISHTLWQTISFVRVTLGTTMVHCEGHRSGDLKHLSVKCSAQSNSEYHSRTQAFVFCLASSLWHTVLLQPPRLPLHSIKLSANLNFFPFPESFMYDSSGPLPLILFCLEWQSIWYIHSPMLGFESKVSKLLFELITTYIHHLPCFLHVFSHYRLWYLSLSIVSIIIWITTINKALLEKNY